MAKMERSSGGLCVCVCVGGGVMSRNGRRMQGSGSWKAIANGNHIIPQNLYDACLPARPQDGHVLVVGGHIAKSGFGDGLKGIRVFSRKTLTMHRIANLTFPRWYPTATLLPSGQVSIMGGTVLPGAGEAAAPASACARSRVLLGGQTSAPCC